MKYLPKFKWENLKEKFEYDRKVRDERLKMSLSQTRREQNFYLSKVEASKRINHIKDRKNKREQKEEDKEQEDLQDSNEENSDEDDQAQHDDVQKKNSKFKNKTKYNRTFNQKEPIVKYSRTKE